MDILGLSVILSILISIVLFIVFIILAICDKHKPIRNIEKLKKETNLYKPFFVRHISGLALNYDVVCQIYFTNYKIVINQIQNGKVLKTFWIDNSKVFSLDEDTIVEKKLVSGDAVGNAIIGGILFGSVGAMVGAASGNSIKDVKQSIDVIKIKYKTNNEEKYIILSCEDKINYEKFINSYNQYILKITNKEMEKIEL